MKKKAQASSATITAKSGTASAPTNRWFDYLFPVVPFLALVPNFFIIPSLSYAGLATQELVYAAAVLLCAALGLAQAWKYPKNELFTRQAVWMFAPLLLFMAWQTFSLTWSANRGESLRQLGLWFGFLVFSVTAWLHLRARTAWWLFYSLFGLAAVLALSLAYEYFAYEQMLGLFFNHGITSELLATLWPLFACVFLFEKEDRLAVALSALAIAFTTGAVMLTIRRGALLGILAASLLILAAWVSGQIKLAHRLRMVMVVFAFLLVVLPVTIVKREALLTRLQGATVLREAAVSESADLGLTSRAITWLTAFEMGKGNWLKGVGLGAYPARYGYYRRFFVENPRYQSIAAVAETEDTDEIRSPLAHSEYLQLFAELGLIGVVMYLLFWSQVLARLWQMRHARLGYLAFAAIASTIALAISAAMSSFAFRQTPSILVLVNVLALGWAVRDRAEEHAANQPEFKLPQSARLGVLGFFAIAGLLMLLQSYNVYASQRAQGSLTVEGQIDFMFALENPSVNEASVRRYQRILDYDPQNAGAHLGLAMLLFQMKRLPECIQHADRAFALSYNRPFTWLLRAFANEHNGAPDKAQEILREGLKSFPKSFILRAALAELLRKRGQREEALQHMAELEKRDQTLARSWALVLRYKDEEATRLAQENYLTPPGDLRPQLARVLAQARAYHYLRGITPAPTPTPQ
jgi:O-antigen ligase